MQKPFVYCVAWLQKSSNNSMIIQDGHRVYPRFQVRGTDSISQQGRVSLTGRNCLEDTTECGGQGWRQNEASSQLRPQALEPDMGWHDRLWGPLSGKTGSSPTRDHC